MYKAGLQVASANSARFGARLNVIVRPNVPGHASHEHEIGLRLKRTKVVDPARHPDRWTFASGLVHWRHQPNLAAILGRPLLPRPHYVAGLFDRHATGAVRNASFRFRLSWSLSPPVCMPR